MDNVLAIFNIYHTADVLVSHRSSYSDGISSVVRGVLQVRIWVAQGFGRFKKDPRGRGYSLQVFQRTL